MKALVIAIPNISASMASASRCIESGRKHGVEVKIYFAITPKDNPKKIFEEEGLSTKLFYDQWSRAENAMSCFLSHYFLWKACSEGTEDYLILEHDAVIVGDIPNVKYRGLLSLGGPSYGKFNIPKKIGVNKLQSKEYLPGAHGYLLKPEAAKKLVEFAKIEARPADVFLNNKNFDFLEEYYPWPVEARDSFTTVQQESGCLAKHNYRTNPETYRII